MDQRASKARAQSVQLTTSAQLQTAAKSAPNKPPKAPPRARANAGTPPQANTRSSKSSPPGRALPPPTPLLLATRTPSTKPTATSQVSYHASKSQVGNKQVGNKQTSKAPPPPQRHGRRAASGAQIPAERVPASSAALAPEPHDVAQQADAQWAQHLAPQSSPDSSSAFSGSTEERDAGALQTSQQPSSAPSNLLDLESEVSALRPRPSDLPPAPAAYAERAPAKRRGQRSSEVYRSKTPSDLSVLFQASAVNSPAAKRAEVGPRPLVQPGSRGYLPKSPLEFLPPPPPPTRRISAGDLGHEDEMPTQARRPASVPPTARAASHRSALIPPPAPPAPPVAERAGARLHSSLPPAVYAGALPQLPPPPALPAGLDRIPGHGYAAQSSYEPQRTPEAPSSYESWDEQEWTASHAPALRVPAVRPLSGADAGLGDMGYSGYTPVSPDVAASGRDFGEHQNENPVYQHGAIHSAYAAPLPYSTGDSVRPTALSVPPSSGFLHKGFLPSGWLPVAGASVMGAALSAGAFMLPQTGQLLVDVSNQTWASLGNVQVFVDGELVCTQSPCAVKLDAKSHHVKAVAPGYQPSQEESVIISDGSVTLHKIQLGASADTGIDVQTAIPNLQLYVDGRRVGSLPRKVMGLSPGEHTISVSGGEHFTSEERRVMVEPNQLLAISDLTPKLKSGSLEVSAGANTEGASVLLDGKNIALPYRAHLTPGQQYRLTARRDGFESFEKVFTLDANAPAASFHIHLTPLPRDASSVQDISPSSEHRRTRTRSNWQSGPMTRAQAVAEALADDTQAYPDESSADPIAKSPATNDVLGAAMRQSVGLPAEDAADTSVAAPAEKALGKGFLNIVTSPSALVLLDGKPMGKTPRRVAVTAGKHSIVLVHASGRKRTTVEVDAGGTKTIKASF
jgi:hypothetical protein